MVYLTVPLQCLLVLCCLPFCRRHVKNLFTYTSTPPPSHWYPDTSDLGHFGPKKLGPKCLNISDLGPKCPMSKSTRNFGPRIFGVFFSVTMNMFWCTCSPRGDPSMTGKMVRDTSDLGKMGEVANY